MGAPLFLCFLLHAFFLLGGISLVAYGSVHHEFALAFLKPVVAVMIPFGEVMAANAAWIIPSAALGATIIVLVALVSRSEATIRVPHSSTFGWGDCLLLLSAFVLGLFFRFYALDRIFNHFDGELSPYMSAATSIRGILFANIGYLGPWAPLGYFYYLPIWLFNQFLEPSLLVVRLAHASVSVLSIPLVYWLVRTLTESSAASAVAALFVAIDPLQIGWGRSDIHPHGSTAFITIMLCVSSFRYFETGRSRFLLVTILLMALSFHQYPSGQFGVLVPVLLLLWNVIFDRQALRRTGWSCALLFIGLPLWYLGWPLQSYLALDQIIIPDFRTIFGGRTSWAGGGEFGSSTMVVFMAEKVLVNIRDLFLGLFYHVPHLHHQDILPSLPNVPLRTLNWLAVSLAFGTGFLALFSRRHKNAVVLVLWIIAGAVPLIFSDVALPKRASTFYIALMALAGVGAGLVFDRLPMWGRRFLFIPFSVVLSIGAVFVATYQWFSGSRFAYGEPVALNVADSLGRLIRPGTIVVADTYDTYMPGRLTFLLSPVLRRTQPAVLYFNNPGLLTFDQFLEDPLRVISRLRQTHFYWWTELHDTLPIVENHQKWETVLLVSQVRSYGTEHLEVARRAEVLREWCHQGTLHPFENGDPIYSFMVLECPLRSLELSRPEPRARSGPGALEQ